MCNKIKDEKEKSGRRRSSQTFTVFLEESECPWFILWLSSTALLTLSLRKVRCPQIRTWQRESPRIGSHSSFQTTWIPHLKNYLPAPTPAPCGSLSQPRERTPGCLEWLAQSHWAHCWPSWDLWGKLLLVGLSISHPPGSVSVTLITTFFFGGFDNP